MGWGRRGQTKRPALNSWRITQPVAGPLCCRQFMERECSEERILAPFWTKRPQAGKDYFFCPDLAGAVRCPMTLDKFFSGCRSRLIRFAALTLTV